MAHLRELPSCTAQCGRPAAVELFNSVNASHGLFCRSCGNKRLKELQHREAAERTRRIAATNGHPHQ